jgi:hypothetical protein
MRAPKVTDIEKAADRATRLFALALQARNQGQVKYAEQLEKMAARAAAEADRQKGGTDIRWMR